MLVYLVFTVLISNALFGGLYRAFGEVAATSLPSAAVSTHARLLTACTAVQFACVEASLLFLGIWAFIAYLGYITCSVVVKLVGGVLYGRPAQAALNRARLTGVLRKFLRPVNAAIYLTFFPAALVVFWPVVMRADNAGDIIPSFITFVLVAVPVVFAAHWFALVWLRARRVRRTYLDWYLFSNESLRGGFQSVVVMLLFLALLGLVLLPGVFVVMERIGAVGAEVLVREFDYEKQRDDLERQGFQPRRTKHRLVDELPAVEELPHHLSPVATAGTLDELKSHVGELQRGFFAVITLTAFISVALPSILRSVLFPQQRSALRTIFLATLKSFAVVLALQLFVQRAYFVDMSNLLGSSAVFSLVVSYFLMMGSSPPPLKAEATAQSLTAAAAAGSECSPPE